MATSRATRIRSEKFAKNVNKRGNVSKGLAEKKQDGFSVPPVLLGFFIFVVIGSSLFQMIQSLSSGKKVFNN